jgi:hypothetical protein
MLTKDQIAAIRAACMQLTYRIEVMRRGAEICDRHALSAASLVLHEQVQTLSAQRCSLETLLQENEVKS